MPCARALVLDALAKLAPLELAEPWDNVGLLVDPTRSESFERAFLTVDLTDATWNEARAWGADLVVAYHPPIFSGLKRLRGDALTERVIVEVIRAGASVYSPHTALDATRGGMTDWLAEALGPGRVRPIQASPSAPDVGAGRLVELDAPVAFDEALARIKAHLGLTHLRVAGPGDEPVRSFAACPGAGGSVFEKVGQVDLLLTGEMRHHDVLARAARGTRVVLTEHTNTERGYLPRFSERLGALCPGLEIAVSRLDRDPLDVR